MGDPSEEIVLPPGDLLIVAARADRELRLLRLGIATVLSLMLVVAMTAILGVDDGLLSLTIASLGAGATLMVDAASFRKIYALTDRHVVVRSRTDTQVVPYDKIKHVRRWVSSLNLTVGDDLITIEDLRDLAMWERIVEERVRAWGR